MSTKKFISFGKIVTLLLLIGYSVSARTTLTTNEFDKQREIGFTKTENALHKNMLQPQVVHVSMMYEHTVKPLNSAYLSPFITNKSSLELNANGQTTTILQDADRCESVSGLLFPFHFFW